MALATKRRRPLLVMTPWRPRSRRGRAAGPLTLGDEIERLYLSAPDTIELRRPERGLRFSSRGWPDLVVWNPWLSKATALPDLKPGDHLRFLCLEPAQLAPIALEPGQSWRARHAITTGVEP